MAFAMTSHDDKAVLVTGASKGIGKAVATRFAAEGADVVVNSRSTERAEAAAADVEDATSSGTAIGIAGDVSNYEDVERLVEETVDRLGGLDVLVGNAGIHDDFVKLDDVPADELDTSFDELFDVNVKGYLNAAKASIPHLRESEGNMIFTASYGSFNTGAGGIFYTPAKHAVAGIVRQLAFELAPEIRVNGVAPDFVPTDLSGMDSLDQGKVLEGLTGEAMESVQEAYPLPLLGPEGYGGYYTFLASEDAAATTGTVITADCGESISL